MDLLDQMLAEAEADMDVNAHEELDRALASGAPHALGGEGGGGGGSGRENGGVSLLPASSGSAPPPRSVPDFMVVGAGDGGWESQVKPDAAAPAAAPGGAEVEHVEGPPPPPEGAEDAPRPDWGVCHLCQTNGSAAFAKFGGGGSSDVPTACSKLVATGPVGRAYWEVRFDKKGAGLCKVGLAYFHTGGPGDPGLELGHNWNDRRGARSSWYLDSEGETYEGNKCMREGAIEYSTGDVVSVELIDGHASFSINYKAVSSGIKVTAWPVTFAVLMVFKGDHVTLLREELMSADEHQRWARTRPERARWWAQEYMARRAQEDAKGVVLPSGGRAASRPGALPSLTAGSTGRNGAAHLRASPGGVGTSFLKGLQEPTPDRPAHKPAQRPPAADSASPAFISDLQMADDLSQHSAMDMDVSEGDFMDIPESDFMDIPLDMDMVHSGNDSGNDSGFTTPGDHAHTLLAHPISPTSALSSPGTEHLGQPGAWSHQLPPVQRTAVPTTVVHTWNEASGQLETRVQSHVGQSHQAYQAAEQAQQQRQQAQHEIPHMTPERWAAMSLEQQQQHQQAVMANWTPEERAQYHQAYEQQQSAEVERAIQQRQMARQTVQTPPKKSGCSCVVQ